MPKYLELKDRWIFTDLCLIREYEEMMHNKIIINGFFCDDPDNPEKLTMKAETLPD